MTEELHGPRQLPGFATARLAAVFVACVVVAWCPGLLGAEQPAVDNTGLVSAVEADALRAEVVMALAEQRHKDVLEAMAKYRELASHGVVVPVSLFAESGRRRRGTGRALAHWANISGAPIRPTRARRSLQISRIVRRTRNSQAHEHELGLAAAAEQAAREQAPTRRSTTMRLPQTW
jgi:hypothetical protein